MLNLASHLVGKVPRIRTRFSHIFPHSFSHKTVHEATSKHVAFSKWATFCLFKDTVRTSRLYQKQKLPFVLPKEEPHSDKKQGQRKLLLTLGACGVFGFWKNLVISAFSALMRCNLIEEEEMRNCVCLQHTKALRTKPQHF